MLWAMLATTGELGYAKITVAEVLRRAGTGRQSFYRLWSNRTECFVEAHRLGMEVLVGQVLEAGAEPDGWREGLRAGLAQLLDLVIQDPPTAQALFIEVHSCKEALPAYYEALDRFGERIDKARRELDPDQSGPPPKTAAIVVGGIEQVLVMEMSEGVSEELWRLLPELMHFAVLPYLGPEAARAELASAPLAPTREGARRRRQREALAVEPRSGPNGHSGDGPLR